MTGYIYQIVNTNNGKYYVGSTSQDPNVRFQSHLRHLRQKEHDNQHLQNAFNKYGEDAFKLRLYAQLECGDRKNLYLLEQQYLDLHVGKPECYNVATKAEGPVSIPGTSNHNFGKKRTEEWKKQLSERNKQLGIMVGKNNPHYGRKWSPSYREKVMAARAMKPHPNKGKTMSDEQKKKISQSKLGTMCGADNHKTKPILQLTKDGLLIKQWESASAAARGLSLSTVANIASCALGKLKTSAGFIWKYKDSVS